MTVSNVGTPPPPPPLNMPSAQHPLTKAQGVKCNVTWVDDKVHYMVDDKVRDMVDDKVRDMGKR